MDVRDIGEVAAKALTSLSQHAAMQYTLTGPQAYSFNEVTQILNRYLADKIRYVPASIPGYMYHLLFIRKQGFMHSLVQTILHTGLRYGQAEEIDPSLDQLLNRKPYSVEDYIRDHIEIWKQSLK